MGLLEGKKVAIFGVANHRSIAYAIAKALAREGAILALSYQGDRLKETVEGLSKEIGAVSVAPCDVTVHKQVLSFMNRLGLIFGWQLDVLVHSIAYVPTEELKGRYIETSLEGARIAHEVSADSLRLLAQHVEPILSEGASIITLTYLGSSFAFPHYNVMGPAKASLEAAVRYLAFDLGKSRRARVNAISAPPIQTLAARAIPGLKNMITAYEEKAPLGHIDVDAVADTAVFLASDLSRAITGETIIADGGYSKMGF